MEPANDTGPGDTLEQALQTHGIELAETARQPLRQWCELVWAANQHTNLTRHTNWNAVVSRDLVDVLALSSLLDEGLEILDIGSGGGVPGLLLAIVRPDLQVSVCESVGKKAKLLQEFVETLNLPVSVFHDRAENVLEDLGFDCCTARAVGPLWKLFSWLDGHWASARKLYAFKGPRWRDELSDAKQRGLTKRLLVKTVARYPLVSTDSDAPPIESFILRVMRAAD